ncbi:tetratricopeptide repeat protein [Shewanella psychrotolerans]|uniref:tetratricopeptide repeat protein n=1 Tax=Shewanella psychrotolerans TaxID=2864206 RepID=UPI001C662148|nr:tetratricopeptide repeat protein [Shewanella psychrotolerans]QYK01793.1 tetratricopeptide repeat protein [Shewanella psychrotolerans]
MSVINTMLKDLDKRQQSHGVDELPVPELQYQRAATSKLPWILLALVSGVLLLGSGIAWQRLELLQQDNVQLTHTIEQAASKGEVVKPAVKVTPIAVDSNRLPKKSAIVADTAVDESHVAQQPMTENIASVSQRLPKAMNLPAPAVASHTKDTEAVMVAANAIGSPQTNSTPDTAVAEVNPAKSAKAPSVKSGNAKPATKSSTNGSGAMVITEVKLSPTELAQKRFGLAQSAQNEGRIKQAQALFAEAVKINPAMHEARQHLAALYYGQGMLTEAESVLAQGLVLYPQEYDYALLQARVYEAAGLLDKALAALTQIPDSNMLAKQKWTMQSHLAQQSKAYGLAEQSYRKLAQVEPQQAKWWMGLAYALDSQSQFSAAKQAYQQALAQRGLSNQAIAFIDSRLAQLGEIE